MVSSDLTVVLTAAQLAELAAGQPVAVSVNGQSITFMRERPSFFMWPLAAKVA